MMYFGSLSDSTSHSVQTRVLLMYCGMGYVVGSVDGEIID